MAKIIQIPVSQSPQFNSSVREWVQIRDGISGPSGLKPNRFVEVKDLYDPSFINALSAYQFPITKVNTNYGYTGDTDVPRPPTNLQVTSEVFRNILTWDDPNSDDFWYIEVFRAKVPAGDAAPTVSDAIKIARVPKTVECFIDTEITVTAYDHYYWIRAVSYSGVASLWQDGYIEGHATVSATIDNIMDILKGADPDAWSSQGYTENDRVLHGGKRYKCILTHGSGQEPPNTTYWERSGILITGEVGGVNTVGIDGNLVIDGSVYAAAINTDDAFIGMTIQSSVYDPGVTGWQINKDGSADFTSGTALWSMITGIGKPDDDADVTSASQQAISWLTDAGVLAGVDDLDGVPNGTTYSRVLTTAISAGKIVLTSSGVSGSLPVSLSDADVSPGLPSDENLVGYWAFDDGSGSIVVDGSGEGQDGDAGTDLTFVDGTVGKAIVGTNNVEITPATALQNAIKTGDFSISFWWTPKEEYDWADVITFDTNTGANHVRFEHGNDDATKAGYWFGLFDGATSYAISKAICLDYHVAHHIVCVCDRTAGSLLFYINGNLDHSVSHSLPTYTTVSKLTFFDASNLDDYLDETRIYNKVLTAAEVKALYLYPAGNKSPIPASLDNLPDGPTYSRVFTTAITAGQILLTAGVTGSLPVANSDAKCTLASATEGADWNTNLTNIPDSMYQIFYQAIAPSSGMSGGDYWIDSDTKIIYRFDGVSTWVNIQDADIAQAITDAATAQATADGKVVTFFQAAAPTAEGTGDIWIDTDDNNKQYRWSGSAWVEAAYDAADWGKIFGANKPDNNADVTSAHTAANAAAYTGALILTSYTTAKCTDALADETSSHDCANPGDYTVSHPQNLGWLIGSTGELTIESGGKLKLNVADALEITAAGNIKVLAGGDIELIGNASNPGNIYFKGTSYSVKLGINATGSECNINPLTNGVTNFTLGAGFLNSSYLFNNIRLTAKNITYLHSLYSSGQQAYVTTTATSTYAFTKFTCRDASLDKNIIFYHNASIKHFAPESNNDIDNGRASYQWKDVYAGTAFKGPLTNNGAYIQARSTNKVSFNWTGSQLDFYVDANNVKTFVIQHPVKAEKYLVHGTLEGPEACVFYRGTGKLEKGYAEINLPNYFEALTEKDGRTIILTMIDRFDKMMIEKQDKEKIKDGKFCVRSENPYSEQEFDWEVKAVRKDVNPLIVEPNKTDCNVKGDGPYTYI